MLRNINISVKVFLLACLLNSATALQVKKCKADDAKCIKQSAQEVLPILIKGIPEFGVETLDPLFFKDVEINTDELKMHLNDVTLKGFKTCKVIKAQRDAAKSKLYGKVLCDIDAAGQYELKGKILVLPIDGKGKASLAIKQILMKIEGDLGEIIGSDGVKHWIVKKYDFSFDLKQKANLKFENLFNGNPVLAKAANDLIESNSNDVIMEIGTPVIKNVLDRFVENVNNFFHAVPLEELTLD